jgi:hypothetical protein
MCRRAQCSTCGKPTYAGCGAHIEQVLGDVPQDQRCRCREADCQDDQDKAAQPKGWIDRLIGR